MDGVYYKLSTDTNNEERIKEMFDTIIGEPQNTILGFTSYCVIAEETWNGFVNWKYYAHVNGIETCIAEVFGYTIPKPEIYQHDFDGDGDGVDDNIPTLITARKAYENIFNRLNKNKNKCFIF